MIPTMVEGSVVFLVNVRGDDAGCLYTHVVQGGGDGAGPDRVGIAGVPAYLDWVC